MILDGSTTKGFLLCSVTPSLWDRGQGLTRPFSEGRYNILGFVLKGLGVGDDQMRSLPEALEVLRSTSFCEGEMISISPLSGKRIFSQKLMDMLTINNAEHYFGGDERRKINLTNLGLELKIIFDFQEEEEVLF